MDSFKYVTWINQVQIHRSKRERHYGHGKKEIILGWNCRMCTRRRRRTSVWRSLPFTWDAGSRRIPRFFGFVLFCLKPKHSCIQFFWTTQWRYCIRLENLGELSVQLRERHWRIFSLSGTLETVRGRGVIGQVAYDNDQTVKWHFT